MNAVPTTVCDLLTKSAAEKVANELRKEGATVTIVKRN
ncbi:MAG: hypothetical protein GWN46_21775 [Gammaproteobacteria bacterium]|nr:hypothetical protein [Gammaproteobacteria bacterium]